MHKINEGRFAILLLALMVVFGAAVGSATRVFQLPSSSFVVSLLTGFLVGVVAVGSRVVAHRLVQQDRLQWLRRQ